MVKFPEADARKFKNVFVCRKCKTKLRAPNQKVLSGRLICKNCNRHVFRTVKKK